MPFDTKKTLTIAERIFNNDNNESGYRSSTNRAYYSCYVKCCELAKNNKLTPQVKRKYNNFSHSELTTKLSKSLIHYSAKRVDF